MPRSCSIRSVIARSPRHDLEDRRLGASRRPAARAGVRTAPLRRSAARARHTCPSTSNRSSTCALVGQLVDQRLRVALHVRGLPVERERRPRRGSRTSPSRSGRRCRRAADRASRTWPARGRSGTPRRQLKRSHRRASSSTSRKRASRSAGGVLARMLPPVVLGVELRRQDGASFAHADRARSPSAAGRAPAPGTGTVPCARSAERHVGAARLHREVEERVRELVGPRLDRVPRVRAPGPGGRPLCERDASPRRRAVPVRRPRSTTRFCSPASPKSSASSEPAYSAGTGAPGTLCGAWMWPIATYCGPAGIACGRGRVRVAHVELAFAARGVASDRHAVHQEVRDQDRHQVGAGALDERVVVRGR